MTGAKDGNGQESNYRKPPPEFQFKRGQSGNPKGRPRKNKAAPSISPFSGGIFDQLDLIALEESARPIAVREGDKTLTMPAVRALIRSMYRTAAQGDAKIQRQLLEMIARAETARVALARDVLQLAIEHKKQYGDLFYQRERDGFKPPEIYPHPDDIEINEHSGEVTIRGPVNKEQAGTEEFATEFAERAKAIF
jgi:hypothetical protein